MCRLGFMVSNDHLMAWSAACEAQARNSWGIAMINRKTPLTRSFPRLLKAFPPVLSVVFPSVPVLSAPVHQCLSPFQMLVFNLLCIVKESRDTAHARAQCAQDTQTQMFSSILSTVCSNIVHIWPVMAPLRFCSLTANEQRRRGDAVRDEGKERQMAGFVFCGREVDSPEAG